MRETTGELTPARLEELARLHAAVRFDYRGLRIFGRFGDAVYESFPALLAAAREREDMRQTIHDLRNRLLAAELARKGQA